MPRRSPVEWRWRPGRAPIYRDSVGIHRGSTWAPPAVALPGSLWAPVELRYRPACYRYIRWTPVSPGRAPVDAPGLHRHHSETGP
ncbi:hypothetical protein DPMN_106569 [Dreissena polymorpha]|uniref:Uncharacterized protein n=1 Tax=Dreissena polymorpha TaxID=45954 RepID=A0A9D4QJ20_DREPO|nr:hypothetical protein DPMN_106569 [Dreissena polymorpha]